MTFQNILNEKLNEGLTVFRESRSLTKTLDKMENRVEKFKTRNYKRFKTSKIL